MQNKILHIKNMVCPRCIKVVKEELESLGLIVEKVELGEAVINPGNENLDMNRIKTVLEINGFELIDSRNANIIERVKILIINAIHHSITDNLTDINLHNEIVNEAGLSYSYVSSLFSSMEGITIEKYIINQKIEKVKELLVYDQLTLSEISYKLGYSSVQHLSNQFKKVTGLSPSYFKKFKPKNRKPIDNIS